MNKYLDSIISIRDKVTDKSIYYKTITIDPIVAKYSNTKTPIYKLVIDGKPISRNNTLVVKYTCITCNAQQEITLNLYIRKINKEGTNCVLCVNQDENKRTTHSNYCRRFRFISRRSNPRSQCCSNNYKNWIFQAHKS